MKQPRLRQVPFAAIFHLNPPTVLHIFMQSATIYLFVLNEQQIFIHFSFFANNFGMSWRKARREVSSWLNCLTLQVFFIYFAAHKYFSCPRHLRDLSHHLNWTSSWIRVTHSLPLEYAKCKLDSKNSTRNDGEDWTLSAYLLDGYNDVCYQNFLETNLFL